VILPCLLSSDESIPEDLCPVLGSSVQERDGHVGACPGNGWEDDQGLGASVLQVEAERAGIA